MGEETLTVALAETSDERVQGLSEIDSLPPGLDGMLFTWDAPVPTRFNMEDTMFDLDIWWFDSEGTLLGTTRMATCLDADCVSYASPGSVLWALETPADTFEFPPGSTLSTVATP